MFACLDVAYGRTDNARTGCVVFDAWTSSAPVHEFTVMSERVAPYEPGQFYRRELPCLLAAIGQLKVQPETIIVDGFVWLDGAGRPGLGAWLFEALNKSVAVVGVSKTAFQGAVSEFVLRGGSKRPLYVTAAGINPVEAACHVSAMHGPNRIPTLLQRVDRLCRRGLILSGNPATPPT